VDYYSLSSLSDLLFFDVCLRGDVSTSTISIIFIFSDDCFEQLTLPTDSLFFVASKQDTLILDLDPLLLDFSFFFDTLTESIFLEIWLSL